MTLFFLILVLGFGIINYLCSIVIMRELAREKNSTLAFDLRWYVMKNLRRYRDMTREKYGRVGPAYYGYLASSACLFLSVVLLLDSLIR
ncbi:hypothetical protein [Geoalkalibacter halelectricus]|uniref:Uncharacterized protein n=1 Tax=Geoalkalibacter halelectricus TaxID=2847045 RepID=A0ABY5ZMY6_9BACT|nr:hypothetical protein [Geoalkalibacter halelectricus]MDO3379982.1 hypothetical protein [Geoalkalibacter halelectricus]UWZ80491.1 hypothetical protein L9S41_03605 [Geoalkalibacter halelectricus]